MIVDARVAIACLTDPSSFEAFCGTIVVACEGIWVQLDFMHIFDWFNFLFCVFC